VSLYPERHVAVLRASDVVPDVRTAVEETGEQLLDDVSDRDGHLVAAGASCRQQLRDLAERAVCHPVALPSPGG